MADYLPAPDTQLLAWAQNFTTYVNANLAALGLVAADVSTMMAAYTGFETAYPAHVTAQANAEALREAKDDKKALFIDAVRPLVKKIQATPIVTDTQRAAMSITVPKESRTPVPPPATRPVAKVDTSERLRHTVEFVDEATSSSRAKPDGAVGCEVWYKVAATPPADPAELAFMGVSSRWNFEASYAGSDAGKTAHYMLRWVNAKGEKGPWSETVSATIGA
jgi:hypothetical protein